MSPAPLLDPARLPELRDLLRTEGADGWLLFDFREQNPIAHSLLGLGKTTRRAFALFPREGDPILLHHAIEGSAWRGWPWEARRYAGWREMETELARLLESSTTLLAEVSSGNAVPTVDRLPSGIAELIRSEGIALASSANLITAFHSRWSDEGLRLHRSAARIVRDVAHRAFEHAAALSHAGASIHEARLADWIRRSLADAGLTVGADCSVAVGERASDPHYHPADAGAPIEPDSLLLIDLWGAFPGGGIPADQTWMGFMGSTPTPRMEEIWSAVRDSRDAALSLLTERWEAGQPLRGYEVDDAARALLEERGLAEWFVHRLGHSIDQELHGSGPNLDHLETRDDRLLLPGIGFSVEPGVYIPGEIGVRTEVNVYWGPEGPEITTPEPQVQLLRFPPG